VNSPDREPFIMLPRSVLARMRSLDAPSRRFLDLVMEEHLRHGGKANGYLVVPHRQIVAAGVTPRLVARCIRRAEASGLIRAHRGGMRVMTLFTLTWLPVADAEPSPRGHRRHKRGRRRTTNIGKIQISAFPRERQIARDLPSRWKADA
jgi:hypothetical protein